MGESGKLSTCFLLCARGIAIQDLFGCAESLLMQASDGKAHGRRPLGVSPCPGGGSDTGAPGGADVRGNRGQGPEG